MGKRFNAEGYALIYLPSHPRASSNGYVLEHIPLAEKVLGEALPPKTVVHHHTPDQIVICQDQAYHLLLHKRQRALEACGNANWRKCNFCKQYDEPKNMFNHSKTMMAHRACRRAYDNEKYKQRRL